MATELDIDPTRTYRFDTGEKLWSFTGAKLLEHADDTRKLFRAIRNGNERRANKIIRRLARNL